MTPDRDWERQLREARFDLSKERWARLEIDLLRRIREADLPRPSLAERMAGALRSWLRPLPATIAAAALTAFFSIGWWLWHAPSPARVASVETLSAWRSGTRLQADSLRTWNWVPARCTLALHGTVRRLESSQGVRLRLESGTLRFGVEPRHPGEDFTVEFGSCQASVVGTAFQLRVEDSGAWASVEHGKVRVQTAGGFQKLLLKGDSWSCREPSHRAYAPPEPPAGSPAQPAAAPSSRPSSKASPTASSEDPAWKALQESCRQEGSTCLEALAEFLQQHPEGAHAAQAARRWAGIAQRNGDLRDALYALDLAGAARAGEPSKQAQLDACALRIDVLHQYREGRQALDALIPTLPAASALRGKAQALRSRAVAALSHPDSL
jgi:hypothetical protein